MSPMKCFYSVILHLKVHCADMNTSGLTKGNEGQMIHQMTLPSKRLVLKIQYNWLKIIILTFKTHSDTGLLRVEEERFSFSLSDQTCRYLNDWRRPVCS